MLARALLLSLLLMNLGVAAWWALRTPPPERRPPATDPGVPPLRLLSETEAPDTGLVSAEAEAVGQPEPADAPAQQCLQIGPFLTQADLRRAMGALTPAVARIQYRENRVLTNRGFWVFLPAQGTREAALAAARERRHRRRSGKHHLAGPVPRPRQRRGPPARSARPGLHARIAGTHRGNPELLDRSGLVPGPGLARPPRRLRRRRRPPAALRMT